MAKRKMPRRKKRFLRVVVVLAALVLLGAVGTGVWWILNGTGMLDALKPPSESSAGTPISLTGGAVMSVIDTINTTNEPAPAFQLEESEGVTWLVIGENRMILVNKTYTVPQSYGNGLTDATWNAYESMRADAQAAGLTLTIVSGYRSYETQESIHNRYLNSGDYTYEYVKEMSAEPGHSEHQLGEALDLGNGVEQYNFSRSFRETDEYAWLEENAHQYGFILRYQDGKTWATGYMYEPWHFRYVGPELAQIFYDSGRTVEEYIGQPNSAPPEGS